MIHKRLYIEPKTFDTNLSKEGFLIVKNNDLRHRILRVLRLTVGDELILFTGQDIEYLVTIQQIVKDSLVFKIKRRLKPLSPLIKDITVYLSLIKKSRFEWGLEKLTELGVKKIVPMICARTVVKIDRIPERFKKIIISAAEQSGRSSIPEIMNPLSFGLAIKDSSDFQEVVNIVFDFKGKKLSDYTDLNKQKKINIFVGPEGGFTQGELNVARSNNFKIIKLGDLTLRSETAAVVGTYCLLNL